MFYILEYQFFRHLNEKFRPILFFLKRPCGGTGNQLLNTFQPSVLFQIETSHFVCSEKQMTGFYMKRNTGLQWVKGIFL